MAELDPRFSEGTSTDQPTTSLSAFDVAAQRTRRSVLEREPPGFATRFMESVIPGVVNATVVNPYKDIVSLLTVAEEKYGKQRTTISDFDPQPEDFLTSPATTGILTSAAMPAIRVASKLARAGTEKIADTPVKIAEETTITPEEILETISGEPFPGNSLELAVKDALTSVKKEVAEIAPPARDEMDTIYSTLTNTPQPEFPKTIELIKDDWYTLAEHEIPWDKYVKEAEDFISNAKKDTDYEKMVVQMAEEQLKKTKAMAEKYPKKLDLDEDAPMFPASVDNVYAENPKVYPHDINWAQYIKEAEDYFEYVKTDKFKDNPTMLAIFENKISDLKAEAQKAMNPPPGKPYNQIWAEAKDSGDLVNFPWDAHIYDTEVYLDFLKKNPALSSEIKSTEQKLAFLKSEKDMSDYLKATKFMEEAPPPGKTLAEILVENKGVDAKDINWQKYLDEADDHLEYLEKNTPEDTVEVWKAEKKVHYLVQQKAEVDKFLGKQAEEDIIKLEDYIDKTEKKLKEKPKVEEEPTPGVRAPEEDIKKAEEFLKPVNFKERYQPDYNEFPVHLRDHLKKIAEEKGYLPLWKGGDLSEYPVTIRDPATKPKERSYFFSDKRDVAKGYVKPGGGTLPFVVRAERTFEIDWKKYRKGNADYSPPAMRAAIEAARKHNADLLLLHNISDIGGMQTQFLVIDVANIRAPNAMFDPDKIKVNGTFLSIAGASVFVPILSTDDPEEE